MKKYHWFSFLFICLFLVFQINADTTAMPTLSKRVNDLAEVLTQTELYNLENQIIAFEKNHPDGSQLAILITTSLPPQTTIEEYANRVFNYWHLGQKDKDNGILLLIALENRKLRIEVGYGFEDQLTDLQSQYIITHYLLPAFKSGRYYLGISDAIKAIDSVIIDPNNNLITEDEKSKAVYDNFLFKAVTLSLLTTVYILLFYIIKPTNLVKAWFTRYFIIWFLCCIGILIYIISNYSVTLAAQMKVWSFFIIFYTCFCLMLLLFFGILQGLIIEPSLNYLINLLRKKYTNINNRIAPSPIKSRTAVICTLIFLIIFTLFSPYIKFLVATTMFFVGFISAFIHQKKIRRSYLSNSSSKGGSGGGFRGGGGRSGGGGSSGSW